MRALALLVAILAAGVLVWWLASTGAADRPGIDLAVTPTSTSAEGAELAPSNVVDAPSEPVATRSEADTHATTPPAPAAEPEGWFVHEASGERIGARKLMLQVVELDTALERELRRLPPWDAWTGEDGSLRVRRLGSPAPGTVRGLHVRSMERTDAWVDLSPDGELPHASGRIVLGSMPPLASGRVKLPELPEGLRQATVYLGPGAWPAVTREPGAPGAPVAADGSFTLTGRTPARRLRLSVLADQIPLGSVEVQKGATDVEIEFERPSLGAVRAQCLVDAGPIARLLQGAAVGQGWTVLGAADEWSFRGREERRSRSASRASSDGKFVIQEIELPFVPAGAARLEIRDRATARVLWFADVHVPADGVCDDPRLDDIDLRGRFTLRRIRPVTPQGAVFSNHPLRLHADGRPPLAALTDGTGVVTFLAPVEELWYSLEIDGWQPAPVEGEGEVTLLPR